MIIHKGSKNDVVCARMGGANTTPLFLRRISQSEIRNSAAAEKRGRAKIHSPQPPFFLPARASGFVPAARSAAIRSFSQKMFEQSCIIPPVSNFPIFAQPIRPREARKGMETLARRRGRGSPSAGSKSLAILSICFAQ